MIDNDICKYTSEIINQKIPAWLIIDDRCIAFSGDYKDLIEKILDIGLLGALALLDSQTLIDGNAIFEEFKGTFAEQYVLQQLKTIPNLPIYDWSNERSKGEIDYIIQYKNEIIPIEVKAAANLKAKSLSQFRKEFEPNKSIRTSLADYELNNGLYNIPLYAINFMKDIIG